MRGTEKERQADNPQENYHSFPLFEVTKEERSIKTGVERERGEKWADSTSPSSKTPLTI